MGKRKTVKLKIIEEPTVIIEAVEPVKESKKEIGKLAIDYSSESLNDMARKINEVIDYLNAV